MIKDYGPLGKWSIETLLAKVESLNRRRDSLFAFSVSSGLGQDPTTATGMIVSIGSHVKYLNIMPDKEPPIKPELKLPICIKSNIFGGNERVTIEIPRYSVLNKVEHLENCIEGYVEAMIEWTRDSAEYNEYVTELLEDVKTAYAAD